MDRPEMGAQPGYDYGRGPQMMNRGVPEQQYAPDDRYQGEYADWVPEHEPDYAPEHFEDEFSGLIDRSKRNRSTRRWAVPLLGVLGVAAVAAAAFLFFGNNPQPPPAANNPPRIGDPAASAGAQCTAERVGNRIKGNDPGGFDSGPGAIFAFQHAYYVARSGEEARAATTPDAAVEPADAIQRGIDTVPAGTTYCVAITPGAFAGQYMVVVTENRPGRPPVTYNPQLVTTTKDDGRTLISAISPGQ